MWARFWSAASSLICSAKQAIWLFFFNIVMGKYVTHVVEHAGNRRCKYVIADDYKPHWSSWAWIKGYFCTAFADTSNQFYCLWNPRKCFGTTWKEPLAINVEDTGIFHVHVYFLFMGINRARDKQVGVALPHKSVKRKGVMEIFLDVLVISSPLLSLGQSK